MDCITCKKQHILKSDCNIFSWKSNMSPPLYSRLYTDTQEKIYVDIIIDFYMVARIAFQTIEGINM